MLSNTFIQSRRLLMNDFQVLQTIKCVKNNVGVLSIENGNLMYDKRIFDNVKEG
jgi:hypothetical protein